jgi:hypothetical protein
MRRLRPTLVLAALGAVLAAASSGCSPATNLLPVNDLQRPTDVAFMCFGAFPSAVTPDAGTGDAGGAALQVSGRPMRSCHPPSLYDPAAGTTSRTFAFMPDSASGGLTMVDADNWKLIDLDPATGGYGQIPLGELPEQISVSDDGCRLISANRGSCDLTLVDPSVLVAPVISRQDDPAVVVPPSRTAAQNIRPLKGDGTFLTAAPYEAVFLPQDTRGLDDGKALCGGPGALAQAGPVGWTKPTGMGVPWYALVTYPSCDLIVLIELPSGRIVQSVHVRSPDGKSVVFEDAGKSPVCFNPDCAGQSVAPMNAGAAGASPVPEAGAAADAGPVPEAGAAADAGPVSALDASADAVPLPALDASADAMGAAADGSSGGADAGAPGMALIPGIQYPDSPYVGPGPADTDGGPGSASYNPGPSGIAIVPDGSRAYVSLSNASFVGSFGISSAGLALPGNAIYLHEGARGSNRIRLSVDPYRYKVGFPADPAYSGPVFSGEFVGADEGSKTTGLNFLYVIAKDGTVRVIQVFNGGAEQECETNVDPLNPLSPPPTTPCVPWNPGLRRVFSVGPGIHFPSLPIDIAATDVRASPVDQSEQSVNGGHAWVMTSSGIVYLVNIDPVLRMYEGPIPPAYATPTAPNITEQQPFENTLRDRNEITYSLTLDPSSGPPRVDVLPSVPPSGPYIEPFWTRGADINATALTSAYVETGVFFPREPNPSSLDDPIDRRAVTPQTWTVTWEGALSGTSYSGHVHPEGYDPALTASKGDRASKFEDGANFCSLGAVPGDLLTLTGCTNNSQCGLGETCVMNSAVTTAAGGVPVNGLCLDSNQIDDKSTKCSRFLNSVRRYEVVVANTSYLVIRPHLDEVVRSGLTPCNPAAATPALSGCVDPDDSTTNKFTCETGYPEPTAATVPRCLMHCTKDADCRSGRVCVPFVGRGDECINGSQCFCADAPPLDADAQLGPDGGSGGSVDAAGSGDADVSANAGSVAGCFDQLTAYQVSVGNGYLVAGSQSGIATLTSAALPDGSCSTDTPPDSFIFRIPMNAPHCQNISDNSIDPRLDPDFAPAAAADASKLLASVETVPSPDPCVYLGGPVSSDPIADPKMPAAPVPQHVRAIFRNRQITFVLANLDRQPSVQLQTAFDVHGGFVAQVVQDPTTVEVSTPARIVVGPVDSQTQLPGTDPPAGFAKQPYLFVVDQRRLGREQGGGPTRGQLLRIHPLGYTSSIGVATGYQPIFQDYTASNGVFPIQ